jgi:hypothetical protein
MLLFFLNIELRAECQLGHCMYWLYRQYWAIVFVMYVGGNLRCQSRPLSHEEFDRESW